METNSNLRLVLSHELDTQELNLEHDTVVVSPEFARRVTEALRNIGPDATVYDFPTPSPATR